MLTPLPDFSQLQQYIGEINLLVEDVMRKDLDTALDQADPLLREVLDYALFNGGKRVRPVLAILSANICGSQNPRLKLLASAFEYLHVATLVHDDVIDHADTRRGKSSVAAKFGIPAAILTGDWLHARSMHIIGQLTGNSGLEVFCQATASMVDGEFLQLRYISELNTSEADYFAVIKRKTGNLISSACAIGSLFASASQEQTTALAIYGDKIGAAFQVVDDLLDYLGDSKKTGKQLGNDFVEGKMTLPLLRAYQRASTIEQQRFTELLTGDRSQPGAYEQIYTLIDSLGGFTSASQTATNLVQEGLDALGLFSSTSHPDSLTTLHQLAHFILARNK